VPLVYRTGLAGVNAPRRLHDDGAPLHFQPRVLAVRSMYSSVSLSERRRLTRSD
jgi:hypothetical protein